MQKPNPSVKYHGDTPRDPASFRTFPRIKGVAAGELQVWLEALQVNPISAVEWDWKPNWNVGPRIMNDSMWFWFESGKGWGWVGDSQNPFRIQGGDLILIPQGVEHAIHANHDSPMHLVAVHFHSQVFGAINLLRLLGLPARNSGEEFFRYVSQSLAREYALKYDGWTQAMRWQILSLLLHIIRSKGDQCKTIYGGISRANLPRLLPAFEFIEQRLGDRSLNMTEVAYKAFLSEVQFRKVFKEATGLSPAKFIQRRRIEKSCFLLRSTQETIDQVAYSCGFADTPYFYRVFHKWMGVSPSFYRNTSRP